MKRTRYDSEYEKVRAQAGLVKPPEFPEDAPLPLDIPAASRTIDEDTKKRLAENAALEAEQDAKRKEEARLFSLKANRDQVLAEYREAGVKPPFVHANGFPTASLSLLRMMGWTVEQLGNERVLVAPPAAPKGSRRSPAYDDQNT